MPLCARSGCTAMATVKYCSRICGGKASRGGDRGAAAVRAGLTRRKRTLQQAVRRSGVLLTAKQLCEGLSSRDQARVLVCIARAYRKGYSRGFQTGWASQHRSRTRMPQVDAA